MSTFAQLMRGRRGMRKRYAQHYDHKGIGQLKCTYCGARPKQLFQYYVGAELDLFCRKECWAHYYIGAVTK